MAVDKVTAYRISAEDATAQAWASAQRTATDSIARLKQEIPGLATALSAAGLIKFGKDGLDAADHLNDLSKSTGIGVEKLAGLQLLARQTGTDVDGLAKAINKMSVEIGKDPEKFRALGITATDNTERFQQFADIFNALPDIAQRNALSMSVFGKSWAEIAPALSEGGERIGEIIDRGTKLSGITQEIARQADALNDKLAELTGTGALFNRFVGPALPLLNELADDLLKVDQNAKGANTSIKPLVAVLQTLVVMASDVSFAFTTMGMDIARAMENVKLIAKGDFAGSKALGEMFRKDAEDRRKALDEYQKKIMSLGLTGESGAGAGRGSVNPPNALAAETAARARQFLGQEKDARDKLNNSMHEQWELMKLIADSEEQWQKAVAQTIAITRKLEDERFASDVRLQEQQADAENAAAANMQRIQKEFDAAAADKAKRMQDDLQRLQQGLLTENEARKFAYEEDVNLLNATLGMKADAQEQYYALMGRLVLNNEKKRTSIEDEEIKRRFGIAQVYRKADVEAALFFSNQLAGLMQTKSRALFEIGKAAAITGAIIDTYKAATGSYAALAGIPIIGPALGAAAAAAAIAIGFARVSAIKSQSFGGGGVASGTVGTYSADPNTGLPETSSSSYEAPVAQSNPNLLPARKVTVTVLGLDDAGGPVSQAWIRKTLLPGIEEALGDGYTLEPA